MAALRSSEYMTTFCCDSLATYIAQVGALQQDVGAVTVRGRQRDPAARLDPEVHPVDLNGLLEGLDDPLGHPDRVVLVPDAGKQHAEFVATEAGEEVPVPEHALDPGPHLDQHPVAVAVSHGVVDLLEAVEVEEHHRTGNALGRRGLEDLCSSGRRSRRGWAVR